VRTKIVRLGLVIAAVFAFNFAGQSSADAATVPPLPSVPSTGAPVVGGLIDSLAGIVTGTYYGAAGATMAVVNSLTGGTP
jgi:hypothetical protein